MKKVLTVALSCMLSIGAFAQTSEIKFGVKAGVNLAKIALSGSDYSPSYGQGSSTSSYKSRMVPSFHIGGLADIPISTSFYVQPGLNLTGKGSEFDYLESQAALNGQPSFSSKYHGTVSVLYLEVPVNLVFKMRSFYVGTGPYIAYAISGKTQGDLTLTLNGLSSNTKENRDLKFGNYYNDADDEDKDNADLRATDFGLNFLAGYQLKNGFNIGASYGLGLTNLTPERPITNVKNNNVISFSIGYMFL